VTLTADAMPTGIPANRLGADLIRTHHNFDTHTRLPAAGRVGANRLAHRDLFSRHISK
jgi:hypothetical protein